MFNIPVTCVMHETLLAACLQTEDMCGGGDVDGCWLSTYYSL
jgi:hypothetical protein